MKSSRDVHKTVMHRLTQSFAMPFLVKLRASEHTK